MSMLLCVSGSGGDSPRHWPGARPGSRGPVAHWGRFNWCVLTCCVGHYTIDIHLFNTLIVMKCHFAFRLLKNYILLNILVLFMHKNLENNMKKKGNQNEKVTLANTQMKAIFIKIHKQVSINILTEHLKLCLIWESMLCQTLHVHNISNT